MSGTEPRMMVVVAHPDDETFGCGSLLAHASARGVVTAVVCATRGEAGSDASPSERTSTDLAAVREQELRAAASLLGVARVQVLDWQDSAMSGEPAPGTLMAAPLVDVASAVAASIDDFEPDIVVTLDASDGHRDHAHIRDATLAAIERAGHRPTRTYLECLPRELMLEWTAILAERDPDSEHLRIEQEGPGALGTPTVDITTVIDTTEYLEIRAKAIAVHASQVSPYDAMPTGLRREFLGAEHLRRIDPPWTGGPIETALFPDQLGFAVSSSEETKESRP